MPPALLVALPLFPPPFPSPPSLRLARSRRRWSFALPDIMNPPPALSYLVPAAGKSHYGLPGEPFESRLLFAAEVAAFAHRGQTRKNRQAAPYINHPLNVAGILLREVGLLEDGDASRRPAHEDAILAGILHDVVEDTDFTLDHIRLYFGDSVAKVVDEATSNTALSKSDRKLDQITSGPMKSYPGRLVKLADKVSNLRDLLLDQPRTWSAERVLAYFAWSHAVCAGMRGTHPRLDALLDDIWQSTITLEGREFRCFDPETAERLRNIGIYGFTDEGDRAAAMADRAQGN
ncbi:hypothetical protein H696_05341 [Fonticula alba]|uniref:Guanosine-3',5'-bis(diphosphate) 3'-pyrophosphohydrolase MESH1 n=1 Tax=Fonticula alba TaxID=691883 RepID=A0A058Z1E3_FONAL|nr:hypothetical protein H696_05341 [Fonticula alba]KCV68089.1 hypothetical protein H696_05341 [Fonticula alba]|eukprot:XP_009497463.1 hypothetical protein H696_05341 [Fonticula alba]